MAHPQLPNLATVILAGGRSTRFGSDKASALLRGEPLLQWVTRALSGLTDQLIIVKARGQQLPPVREPVTVIEDRFDALGPLAGMVAGFEAATHPLALVVSCDAPLLRPGLVTYLASHAEGHDIVLPFAHGFPQPLLAVYRRETCLPAFRDAVTSGNLKITAAFHGLRLHRIDEATLRQFDPNLASFRNCNTPDALAEIEAVLHEDADLA